ncbi:MAG: hypothetical protein HZA50_07830 [Planctomycetes bacterium]|nr:hypothetical protein [Planctomycetota bacterium]
MTGLLCRWVLLALAVAAVAAACVAGLYATGAVARDINTAVLPSDAVAAKDSKFAHVVPSCTHAIRDQEYYGGLVYTLDGGAAPRQIKYFYAEPDAQSLSVGRHILEFHGVPYGAHAFESFSAILDVVPAQTEIFLIDAAFAEAPDAAAACDLADIIRFAGRNYGRAVFVCAKRQEDNRDCRRLVYDAFGTHPVILPFEWAKRKESVLVSIRTNIPDSGRLILLTKTPELAAEAEKHGIETHLAGRFENFPKSTGSVTVHASLRSLRDWLARRGGRGRLPSQPASDRGP